MIFGKKFKSNSLLRVLILSAAFSSAIPEVQASQAADQLNRSPKGFSCETVKHQVRVDLSNKEKISYRSWNKPRAVDEKPDMEVIGGTVEHVDSKFCEYNEYRFKKGAVEFVVYDEPCVKEKSPATAKGVLEVYISGKQKGDYWCN